MNKAIVVLFAVCFFCYSCSTDVEFVQYKQVEKSVWKATDSIQFYFKVQDTINPKNVFIHIRNTPKYPFANLYIITQLQYPNQNTVIDTLQYQMADDYGKLLGNGLSTIKESKLYYKENFKFLKSGNYKLMIQQAMRKNGEIETIDLQGVNDVGLSIEKIE